MQFKTSTIIFVASLLTNKVFAESFPNADASALAETESDAMRRLPMGVSHRGPRGSMRPRMMARYAEAEADSDADSDAETRGGGMGRGTRGGRRGRSRSSSAGIEAREAEPETRGGGMGRGGRGSRGGRSRSRSPSAGVEARDAEPETRGGGMGRGGRGSRGGRSRSRSPSAGVEARDAEPETRGGGMGRGGRGSRGGRSRSRSPSAGVEARDAEPETRGGAMGRGGRGSRGGRSRSRSSSAGVEARGAEPFVRGGSADRGGMGRIGRSPVRSGRRSPPHVQARDAEPKGGANRATARRVGSGASRGLEHAANAATIAGAVQGAVSARDAEPETRGGRYRGSSPRRGLQARDAKGGARRATARRVGAHASSGFDAVTNIANIGSTIHGIVSPQQQQKRDAFPEADADSDADAESDSETDAEPLFGAAFRAIGRIARKHGSKVTSGLSTGAQVSSTLQARDAKFAGTRSGPGRRVGSPRRSARAYTKRSAMRRAGPNRGGAGQQRRAGRRGGSEL